MKFTVTLATLSAALLFAACDSVGVGGKSNLSVSFATPKSSTRSASLVADTVTLNGHTLSLENVDVTFSKIQLDRHEDNVAENDSASDEDGEHSADDEEVKVGETTIALPLGGGVITPINQSLPPGDYESLEMKVSSVRLRGTYDGQAFDVTVPVRAEFATELNPPFHVASDTDRLNLTVKIDVSQWLRTSGGLVDPRLLATNETLRRTVIHQIRASFHSFEDENRNGDDDHDEHND